jgi:hypothetical protein
LWTIVHHTFHKHFCCVSEIRSLFCSNQQNTMASATASSILERVIEVMPFDECQSVGRHACYQLKYKYKGVSYEQYVYVKSKNTPLEHWFPLPWAHPLLVPTEDIALPVYKGSFAGPYMYKDYQEILFWREYGKNGKAYFEEGEYSLGDEYGAVRRCKCYNYGSEHVPGEDCHSSAGIRCRQLYFHATKSFVKKLKHHALTKERMYLPGLRYMDITSLERRAYSRKEVDRTPPNEKKRKRVQLTIEESFKPVRKQPRDLTSWVVPRPVKPKRPQLDQPFVLGNYIASYL